VKSKNRKNNRKKDKKMEIVVRLLVVAMIGIGSGENAVKIDRE